MSNCPLCKSSEYELEFKLTDQYQDEYELVRCKKCGCRFPHPFPDSEKLKRAYQNSYYGEGEKKFSPLIEKVLDTFRRQKAKKIARHLEKGAKILDIGCGDGQLLHQLSRIGEFELHGLELEGKAADRAEKKVQLHLHKGELKKGIYPAEYFDAICLIHVFEHLPDPAETVKTMAGILKDGGRLFLEQPNIDSWQSKLFKGNWLHLDPPRHLNFLNREQLVILMAKHDLELHSISHFSPQFSPFGFQQSLLNLLMNKRELLYEHLKGNHQYTSNSSSTALWLQKLFYWITFPLFIFSDAIASFFGKGATMKLEFRKQLKGH